MIGAVLATRFMPIGDTPQLQSLKRFDTTGALLLAATLTCFFLGMTRASQADFGGNLTPILLIAAAIGLLGFLRTQQHGSAPLIELRLFRSLELSGSLLLSVIAYAFTNTVIFILPFFFKLVKHYPEQQIGLLVAVLPVSAVCVGPLAGWLADRLGTKAVSATGLVLLLVSCWAIGTFSKDLTTAGYLCRIVPLGVGFGIFQPPNQSAILSSVSTQYRSVAAGLWFFSRAFGQVLGIATIGILFSTLTNSQLQTDAVVAVTDAPVEALVFGEQMSFRIIAIALAIAIVLSGFLWQQQHQTE